MNLTDFLPLPNFKKMAWVPVLIAAFVVVLLIGLITLIAPALGALFWAVILFVIGVLLRDVQLWKGKSLTLTLGGVSILMAAGLVLMTLAGVQLEGLQPAVLSAPSMVSSIGGTTPVSPGMVDPSSGFNIVLVILAVFAMVFIASEYGGKQQAIKVRKR